MCMAACTAAGYLIPYQMDLIQSRATSQARRRILKSEIFHRARVLRSLFTGARDAFDRRRKSGGEVSARAEPADFVERIEALKRPAPRNVAQRAQCGSSIVRSPVL